MRSSAHAEKHRYGVVRDFCGHGLGQLFHDAPEVVHVGKPGTGPELRPGMFFTIEPMINIGKADVKLLEDGWTAGDARPVRCRRSSSIRSGSPRGGCEDLHAQPQGLSPAAVLKVVSAMCMF